MKPIDIDRAAAVLIEQYGDEAYKDAIERSDELYRERAEKGAIVFAEVAEAIIRIQSTANDNSTTEHRTS